MAFRLSAKQQWILTAIEQITSIGFAGTFDYCKCLSQVGLEDHFREISYRELVENLYYKEGLLTVFHGCKFNITRSILHKVLFCLLRFLPNFFRRTRFPKLLEIISNCLISNSLLYWGNSIRNVMIVDRKLSVLSAARKIWSKGGIINFFRGFEVSVASLLISSILATFMQEKIFDVYQMKTKLIHYINFIESEENDYIFIDTSYLDLQDVAFNSNINDILQQIISDSSHESINNENHLPNSPHNDDGELQNNNGDGDNDDDNDDDDDDENINNLNHVNDDNIIIENLGDHLQLSDSFHDVIANYDDNDDISNEGNNDNDDGGDNDDNNNAIVQPIEEFVNEQNEDLQHDVHDLLDNNDFAANIELEIEDVNNEVDEENEISQEELLIYGYFPKWSDLLLNLAHYVSIRSAGFIFIKTLTFPLEIIVRIMQVDNLNCTQAIVSSLAAGGFKSFYRGLPFEIVKIPLQVTSSIVVSMLLSRLFLYYNGYTEKPWSTRLSPHVPNINIERKREWKVANKLGIQ